MNDPISRLMCCILGGVNASYVDAGFEPLQHTYISQTLVEPVCASHGYATIMWEGKTFDEALINSYGFTGTHVTECLRRGVDRFMLRVGACAPPSPSLMILASQGSICPGDELYGSCEPCDTDLTQYTPPTHTGGCVAPVGVDPETGALVWPVQNEPESHADFSRRLIMQAQAVLKGVRANTCVCVAECYTGETRLHKANIRFGDADWWTENRFAGIDIPIGIMAG